MAKAIAAIAVIAMLSICSIPLQIIGEASADPTYGVRLTARYDPETGITEPMMKNIRLPEEIVFNITVTNVGTGVIEPDRDKIHLWIENSTIPIGWSAWLDIPPNQGNDNPDYVRLASDESTTIVLHVNAPWVGWDGDTACINITGNSSNDHSAIDTISVYAVLKVHVDFDLQFMKAPDQDPLSPYSGEKYDRINPGAEQQYIISISNKGDLNDTYELNLSEPSDGWDWYFVDTGTRHIDIDLDSYIFNGISGATLTMMVECPLDALAYEEGDINLTGWSRIMEDHGLNLSRSDVLKLVTGSVGGTYLTVDNDTFHSYPDQAVFVDCTIHSTANHDIKVRLVDEGTPSRWVVIYPQEDILVPTFSSVTVQIRIIPPGSVWQAGYEHYSYIRIGRWGSSMDDLVNITFINGGDGEFELSVTQDFSEVLPGKGSGAVIKMISHSDRSMNVTVEVPDALASWHVQLDNRPGPRTYELGPWGENWAPVTLIVPGDALMGEHRINITAWTDRRMDNISLPIRVGQAHMIDIGHYKGPPPYDPGWDPFAIPANATEQGWFFVENLGNGPERVNLAFGEERITGDLARWDIGIVSVGRAMEDEPDVPNDGGGDFDLARLGRGFEYRTLYDGRGHMLEFRDIWVVLGARETAWVRVHLGAPGPEIMKLAERSSLVYLARTVTGTLYRNVSLSVLYPDLEVGSVTILGPGGGPPVHDENVTVGITVRNNGTTLADDVLVTISVGGSVVASGRIPTIGPGGSESIELRFIASRHLRHMEIEIDPDNEIVESADQFMENGTGDNNRRSESFEVTERDASHERSPLVLWAAIAIAVVLAVVGAAQLLAMRSRRRRRRKEVFVPE